MVNEKIQSCILLNETPNLPLKLIEGRSYVLSCNVISNASSDLNIDYECESWDNMVPGGGFIEEPEYELPAPSEEFATPEVGVLGMQRRLLIE